MAESGGGLQRSSSTGGIINNGGGGGGGGGGGTSRTTVEEDEDEEFSPPENFAMVEPGIYRSAFPVKRNFPFLERRARLRSVLTLVLEEYPTANCAFNDRCGVTLYQFGMEGNKEPFRQMPFEKAVPALRVLLDRRNHPILIHCNEGKHRTGAMVGMLRRYRRWSLACIFDEYLLFSGAKGRTADQRFIERFDPSLVDDPAYPPPLPPPPPPSSSSPSSPLPGSSKGGAAEDGDGEGATKGGGDDSETAAVGSGHDDDDDDDGDDDDDEKKAKKKAKKKKKKKDKDKDKDGGSKAEAHFESELHAEPTATAVEGTGVSIGGGEFL